MVGEYSTCVRLLWPCLAASTPGAMNVKPHDEKVPKYPPCQRTHLPLTAFLSLSGLRAPRVEAVRKMGQSVAAVVATGVDRAFNSTPAAARPDERQRVAMRRAVVFIAVTDDGKAMRNSAMPRASASSTACWV